MHIMRGKDRTDGNREAWDVITVLVDVSRDQQNRKRKTKTMDLGQQTV